MRNVHLRKSTKTRNRLKFSMVGIGAHFKASGLDEIQYLIFKEIRLYQTVVLIVILSLKLT